MTGIQSKRARLAEQRATAETKARQVAEPRATVEAQARQVAEPRTQALEAELERLKALLAKS